MSKSILGLTLLAAIAATSGCVSVLPDPEPANAIYRLNMPATKLEAMRSAPIIRIDQPAAARMVGTRKIIVSPDAQRLAIAGGAEWADALPNMVQKALVDKMATRADMIGVMPSAGARADYRVHMNIDNFEARFDNGPETAPLVMISYSVTFADMGSRQLLGTRQFSHSQRAGSPRVSSIVSAMNQANNSAMEELTNWVMTLTSTS